MKQTQMTTTVLTAEQGHYITQRADTSSTDRIIAQTIYLAATDSPDNYREITESEAEQYRAEAASAIDAAVAEAAAIAFTSSRQTKG